MFSSLFQRSGQTAVQPRIANVTIPELQQRLESDAAPILVDVRSPMEYQYEGHIAGARLLPLQVLQRRLSELPTDQPIVCVCRSGNRSQVACEILAAAGFDNVANLGGGMIAWQMAGLPVNR